jgi:hypothetical protein
VDRPVKEVVDQAVNWIEVFASVCDLGIEETGLELTIISGRAFDIYRTHQWQVQKRRKLVAAGTSLPEATDYPSS